MRDYARKLRKHEKTRENTRKHDFSVFSVEFYLVFQLDLVDGDGRAGGGVGPPPPPFPPSARAVPSHRGIPGNTREYPGIHVAR